MNYVTRSKNVTKLVLLLVLMVILTCVMVEKADASGGIAISGSFYRQHFRMVPGEIFDSPDVNIVVFNNFDSDINVQFNTTVPIGTKIDLGNSQIQIPANSSVKLPVKLVLADTVVPGSYIISISAEIVPDPDSGITIVSSAQIRSNLTIFGEAGSVKINTKTAEGHPFAGKINLFYKDIDKNQIVGYSQTGELSERIIPGKYFIQATWNNNEIASDSFELKVNEEKDISLQVQTVFIQDFTVNSQDADEKNISSGLTYVIKNIYAPIKDARLCLQVYYAKTQKDFNLSNKQEKDSNKTNLIEEIELLQLPVLEVGSQSGRGTYIPPDGWKNGIYKFRLVLYGKEKYSETELVKTSSKDIDVAVHRSNYTSYFIIIIIILTISTFFWYVFLKKRNNGVVIYENKN